MIIISFEDQALHDICVDLQCAEKLYGSVDANALVTFLAETQASDNVAEVIDLHQENIRISESDSILLSIGSEHFVELVAAGTRFKHDADDRVVWTTVTRLKLVQISRRL